MSISVTDNINSFNVSNVSNVSNHHTIADDRSEILKWLSPLEPRIWHQDARAHRIDNVGEWLLQTEEFQRWCDVAQHEGPDHQILFCCGGPGVGKTYFSSLVVDKLCDVARERNIAVSCFYVDFAAREEQFPTNILGSLLKQIVSGLEKIPDEICEAFRDQEKVIGGRGLRMAEVVKMLQIATSSRPTFICVDALDECVERYRPEILDSLRQILEKSPNTRIFLTGRRHIQGEVDRHLGARAIVLSIKPKRDDIVGYIRMRLSKDTSQDRMDGGLEDEIIKSITGNIPETYLLISLTMDAILGETTACGRRRKLRAMTEGLDLEGVYGATLERIKELGGEKTRLGMATLMWVSHSERLLQLDELSHALAVEIGSTDLIAENVPSVETLLSCCLGLVVVDREASTVRLMHFTLREYLYTCPEIFGPTHSVMAETCLTYLNFPTIKNISSTPSILPHSTPFLKYSSVYWGVHARRDASKAVVSLALQFLSQIETHVSTKLLLEDVGQRTDLYYRIPTNGPLIGFTGLHCASVFGIVEITDSLMGQPNYNLNKRDFLGITPLIWAVRCGQEEVVKLLLERQTISPDKPDRYPGRTALAWAAVMGHERIVRLLLSRASAKPDGIDGWWGKTPRMVNKALGRRYVDPNRPNEYRRTPILLAAKQGHEGVVKLLLGRKDVKPHMADDDGLTPLSWAAKNGHDGVVKLLPGREDLNPNMPDNDGRTPFSWAAGSSYDLVVGLLLDREDINPNMPDNDGRTPFSWATGSGSNRVVKLLLERGGINPNMPDNSGRTPLSWAAGAGCEGVVELLLGREGVNLDVPDNSGQTPFSWAAKEGRDCVVKLLLRREDLNPNVSDNCGRTPLSWAAGNGRNEVVKLLLLQDGVNPNILDNSGRTPLSWAAGQGESPAVMLLLRREGVSPDAPDNDGRTPLSWAAGNSHSSLMGLLLEQDDINPDMPDNDGRTPLSWAAGSGHHWVVKPFLGRKDINPNMPDNGGRTPLSWAAGSGNDKAVKLLLEREDVNPDMPNKDGLTPLSFASTKRHHGAAKLLLAHKSTNSKPA